MRYTKYLTFIFLLTFFTLGKGSSAQTGGYTVYFQSDRDGKPGIYRIEGSEAVQVVGENAQHPSVTADGRMLFYTKFVETSWGKFWNIFYLVDGQEYKLTRNEIYDELEPVVSHDGTFVAFTSMREANLEIITFPLRARTQSDLQYQVTQSPKPDEQPALANGDKWVYWTGRTGNHSYIFRAPGRGGEIERVSGEGYVWEEHPSLSADGRYLVYAAITEEKVEEEGEQAKNKSEASEKEGNSDIWILDLVTKERKRLTFEKSWEGNPCISADGKVIVFTSDRDGNYEIYMMNRDGSGLRRLTTNEATDDFATIT